MIQLYKLHGEEIWINMDHIRYIEKTPDTLLRFMDGTTIMVKETPEEVVSKIVEFRNRCCLSQLQKKPVEGQGG